MCGNFGCRTFFIAINSQKDLGGNKMLKKSIAVVLSMCMLFSLCACNSDNDEKKSKKSESKSDNIRNEQTSDDINIDNDSTDESVTTEKLSESCTMVLCTGTNNNDFYELVANQIDNYPDTTYEFGVIKNNKWLIPMGSDCPFIDENGWWVEAEGTNKPRDIRYIEEGCFYYNYKDSYGYKIIYKPESGVSFNVLSLYEDPNAEYGRRPYSINGESELIVKIYDIDNKHPLTYINMDTEYKDRDGIRWSKDNIFAPRTNESLDDPNYTKRTEVFQKEINPYEKGYEEGYEEGYKDAYHSR